MLCSEARHKICYQRIQNSEQAALCTKSPTHTRTCVISDNIQDGESVIDRYQIWHIMSFNLDLSRKLM